MPVMRRVICALATVTSCLALAACGEDEPPSAQKPAPANAGAGSGLGPERFKALDAVYVASLPVDEFSDDERFDREAFAAATRPAIAACDALDADDALLGPLRRMCPLLTQLQRQLLGILSCGADDPDRCVATVDAALRTEADFARLGRRSDRAIERSALKGACKQSLIAPPLAYEVFDGYGRALALFRRGITTPSPADVERGRRVLAQAGAKADRLPSAGQSLDRFRRDCA